MRPVYLLVVLLSCASAKAYPPDRGALDSLYGALQQATTPQQKLTAHSGLWDAYINTNIDSALQHADRIMALGERLSVDSMYYNGVLKKGIGFAYLNRFDRSGVYFRRALAYYQAVEDTKTVASILRNMGQDHNMQGKLDSATHYYRLAGERYAQAGDSVGMADIYNSEAVLYFMQGFFNLAFAKAVTAEGIYMRTPGMANDLNQNRLVIAATYGAMNDTLNAIAYHRKTAAFFKEQGMLRQYASNSILLGNLLVHRHEAHPELSNLVQELVLISTDLQDQALITQAKLLEAELYIQQGDLDVALGLLEPLAQQNGGTANAPGQAETVLTLGRALLEAGEISRAIVALQKADDRFRDLAMEVDQIEAKRYLALAFEQAGDFPNSLKAFKAHTALDKKLFDERRTREFDELQTIYETEQKEHALAMQEQTIAALNAEARANRIARIGYGIGMVSFLLIAVLTAVIYRQKSKKSALERKQQETQYQQEIAFKKKELTSQTLHLVQKNAFIQELKEKLDLIKASPDRFAEEYRRIVSLLHHHAIEDESWEVFKSYFSEVHNDFDVHLKAMAPDITENEVRLASFLRMNLTNKEIASLLHVQPESVMKSKYRLKKKLGLVKTDDLDAFLNNLQAASQY